MAEAPQAICSRKRKPTLLKLAVVLLLFLAGGATVNVAVAWGCARFVRFELESRGSLNAADEAFLDGTGETFNPSIIFYQRTGFGIDQRSLPLEDALEYEIEVDRLRKQFEESRNAGHPSPPLAFLHQIAAGWPIHSMAGSLWDHSLSWLESNGLGVDTSTFRVESGILIGPAIQQRHSFGMRLDGQHRILPLRPIWPGFAINTTFYALVLWLLWIAPGTIRRFVRIRQHRCPACGFIIAPNTCANGLCSECGASLPFPLRGRAREGVGRTSDESAR